MYIMHILWPSHQITLILLFPRFKNKVYKDLKIVVIFAILIYFSYKSSSLEALFNRGPAWPSHWRPQAFPERPADAH